MSKSVRELADEIGVSKQAVMKKMTPDFRRRYVHKNANQLSISPTGEKVIKQAFEQIIDNQIEDIIDNQSTTSWRLEKVYQDQLKQKDNQIETLQKLLDQQQQLQLKSQQENEKLRNQNQRLLETHVAKKSFWQSLFKRGRKNE